VRPSVSSLRQPISKAGIEAAWVRIKAVAKLDGVRLHDLRHTVGTYAANPVLTPSLCVICFGTGTWQ
jgi:integrase